jgi:hypothetical protein
MIGECTECESLCGAPTVYEDDGTRLVRVTFPSGELCDECEAFKRGVDFVLSVVGDGYYGVSERLSHAVVDGSKDRGGRI